MPLPRVRFTVRRMMVAVVVVAMAFGGGLSLHRRAARFRAMAHYHSPWVNQPPWQTSARIFRYGAVSLRTDDGRAAWHAALWRKYDRAARSPWLPVAPDPPEPE